MSVHKFRRHLIGAASILFMLTGCAEPSEQPALSPSATAADAQPTASAAPEIVQVEEVYCPCEAILLIEAYIDHNANGKREAWEDPLQDVRFRVERRNPKESPTSQKEVFYVESNATGQAGYTVSGCCPGDDLGTVYAEVPPDYRLTTPDRCSTGHCVFGFAALRVTPISVREADLRGADLHGADLRGEDLRDADLTGANLHEADLRGATLRNAQLTGADLEGADLSLADLSSADLSNADLQEADLRDADLTGANLREANLRGAKLGNLQLGGDNLQRADLSGGQPEGSQPQ